MKRMALPAMAASRNAGRLGDTWAIAMLYPQYAEALWESFRVWVPNGHTKGTSAREQRDLERRVGGENGQVVPVYARHDV